MNRQPPRCISTLSQSAGDERRLGARDWLVRRVTLVLTLGVFLVEDAFAENHHAGFAGWNGTGGTATLRN